MENISRRKFIRTAVIGGTMSSIMPGFAHGLPGRSASPLYIAAYDTESTGCLAACRKIVEVHRRFRIPATFFIVGRVLEANAEEYRELLDDPLFEIATHTYSHRMLRDNPFCGPAVSPEEKRKEIFDGKAAVERIFKRPCLGIRPGCSFDTALRGAKDVLALVKESGLKYVSSLAWGPDYSLPALLVDPFTYETDGYPDIWELPAHGWHENLLKNNNRMGPRRITLWPPEMPEAIPEKFITGPDEEFEINRIFIDKAIQTGKTFVSLIWHPWSLHSFDPEMRMLELTFDYVRKLRLNEGTYADLYSSMVT